MQPSSEEVASMQEANRIYEWRQDCLVRKSDGSLVANVARVKDVWVAKDKSRKTDTKIGEYTEEISARHAVDLHFGLKLSE